MPSRTNIMHFIPKLIHLSLLCVLILPSLGCRTPANLAWTRQLNLAGEKVNETAKRNEGAVSTTELKLMLDMQWDGEPTLTIPVAGMPSILADAVQIDFHYHRYPDWVLGELWSQFAANSGHRATPFGWRENPDFSACTCWLYVELSMPTVGKSPNDPNFMHDDIVHVFLVRGTQVIAAVRIEPWHGKEPDLFEVRQRRKTTTRPVS